MNNTAKRMEELMVLVDKSLMLTDNDNERLMLACAMMQRTNEIFEEMTEFGGITLVTFKCAKLFQSTKIQDISCRIQANSYTKIAVSIELN
jgi:hypothetical protein